jgi:cobyrinic acid a,c-diamide synthase
VYFSGACLFEYAELLRDNAALFADLETFIDQGGVLYAEGAGSAFLSGSYIQEGSSDRFTGLGVLSGNARCLSTATEPKPVRYEFLEETVLAANGETVSGLFPGDWTSDGVSRNLQTARLQVKGQRDFLEGFSPSPQAFCTFGFLQFLSAPLVAKRLVDSAEVVQLRRSRK